MPAEVASQILARMDALDPSINAFCARDAEVTIAQADASTVRWMQGRALGPLDGVPVSIKDLIVAPGFPTRYGSMAVRRGTHAAPDHVAARLLEAGAVILGKTTTPEFGNGGTTESEATGITRNPWNVTKTPGGSSGGSAAAVAAGLGALSVGTDSGGSIRTPAGFCGICGFKPSFGLVAQPSWLDCDGMGTIGPMARSVADLADFMDVTAGSLGSGFASSLEGNVRELRVAWSADLGFSPIEEEVRCAFDRARDVFAALRTGLKQDYPKFGNPIAWFGEVWALAMADSADRFPAFEEEKLGDAMRRTFGRGAAVTLQRRKELANLRRHLRYVLDAFFVRYDCLVTPAAVVEPFDIADGKPAEWDFVSKNYETVAAPFSLAGCPAAVLPAAMLPSGLPFGLQIVGPVGSDRIVLRLAQAFWREISFDAHPFC